MKKIEKVIFPMNTIKISQGQLYDGQNASHQNRHAWDLGGALSTKSDICEEAYAPCTCKLIRFPKENEFNEDRKTNTAYFGTCDEEGNPTEVMCADGQMRILTFALTHCDDFNRDVIKDKIYEPGELFYKEGGRYDGKDKIVDKHIHIEVAGNWHPEGKANREVYVDGIPYTTWQMEYTLNLQKIFFRLPSQEYIHNDIKEGITIDNFPLTQSRYVEEGDLQFEIKKEKFKNVEVNYIEANKYIFDLRFKHPDDYSFFTGYNRGEKLDELSDIAAVSGGPFTRSSEDPDILIATGLYMNDFRDIVGQKDSNPIMGFKNGRLVEITHTVNNQNNQRYKYDWIRSCNKFILIKNAKSIPENLTKTGFNSTVAHSVVGQLQNGNYILFCSKPGLTLKDVTEFLLSKNCEIAFNLVDGEESGLVVNNSYLIKNSEQDIKLFDAIGIDSKWNSPINEQLLLKMKSYNKPIQAKYDNFDSEGETIIIPAGEEVIITKLKEPEGVEKQKGILEYKGVSYKFEYDKDNMKFYGNIPYQKYYVKILNEFGGIPITKIFKGIIIDTGEEIILPKDTNIYVSKIELNISVPAPQKMVCTGMLDGNIILFELEYPSMYLSNYIKIESGGWAA